MTPNRLLSLLVENRPGVLHRVASMIRRRGFNIESLSVGPTEDPTVSRMTIAVHVGQQQAEQARRQIEKLVDVIEVDDITGEPAVAHELLLVRMHSPVEMRRALLDIVEIFRGRVVDVATDAVILEVTGSTEKIDNLLELLVPFGIKEVARSGAVAMVRGSQARLSLNGELRVAAEDDVHTPPVGMTGDMTGTV